MLENEINNMENLLKVYSTRQITDSDTVTVSIDSSGVYPMIKLNTVNVEYDEITNNYRRINY